jgi:hypothetical protein
MTRLETKLLDNRAQVTLATWEGLRPTDHTDHTSAVRFDEASGRGQFSFYDSTKEYMRNTWAFDNMAHCRVGVDRQTVMLFHNRKTDSWHTVDALDIDHVDQVMDHFRAVGVRTVADGMMAYNDVSNLRLLPSAYNRARASVDEMLDPASGPRGTREFEAWKSSKFGFDSSPDAPIPVYDPDAHRVRHRSLEEWSLADGRKGLYFDQKIRDVWFEQELAKSYVGDAEFEFEGRPRRVPLFLCVASGQYVTRDAFDIDHRMPFAERLGAGIDAAKAKGEVFTKGKALDIFNDTENLRLVSRSANSSHDYEHGPDGITLVTDLREERRDALRDDLDDGADFIDDGVPTIAVLPTRLDNLVSDALPTIRVESVMLPGGRPAATTALPSGDDDSLRATLIPAVRRGLDPESWLDSASNPSYEMFRQVNAELRDDLREQKQASHPTDARVGLNEAEIVRSERAAASVVALARHYGITIGGVSLNDSGMIQVRGRTAVGREASFEQAFGVSAEIPIETSSADWRRNWYRDLYAPARRGLDEIELASQTPRHPQALNNAAVLLAKVAEDRGMPFISEVARDDKTGRTIIRMCAPNGRLLDSAEVPESELEKHRDTVRRIDHPLHHRHEEFQGLRAAVLDESERRALEVTDAQAGNVAAFAIARAEEAGFPISAIVLAPETRSVQLYARVPEGKGFPDPSLEFPLDRAIATGILESSRTSPPIADRDTALAPRASTSDVVSIGDPAHPCAPDFRGLKAYLGGKFWSGATEGEIDNAAAHIIAESRVMGISRFNLHFETKNEAWVIETGRGDAGQRFKVVLEAAADIDMTESSRRWQEASRTPDTTPALPTGPSQGR